MFLRNEFIKNIKEVKLTKKMKIAIVAILTVVTVCVYLIPGSKKEETVINNTTQVETDQEQMEKVLSSIKGAGKVKVMITYVSSDETVAAQKIEKQTSTTVDESETGKRTSTTTVENSSPMTLGSGNDESEFAIKNNKAEIKGVIVISQGADDIGVRLKLKKAVETVLQISDSQVEIFTMN